MKIKPGDSCPLRGQENTILFSESTNSVKRLLTIQKLETDNVRYLVNSQFHRIFHYLVFLRLDAKTTKIILIIIVIIAIMQITFLIATILYSYVRRRRQRVKRPYYPLPLHAQLEADD